MRWLHPRRMPFRSPNIDESVDEAERNLEHVRAIAKRAVEQAAAAQAAITALTKRTEPNG